MSENRFTPQMEHFFKKASQLVEQGSQQMEARPRIQFPPYFYQNFQVTIGDETFQISKMVGRGGYDDHNYEWRTRDSISVFFTPEAEDNLRLVKGVKSELPMFAVYQEDGEYHGALKFDLKHVQRRHVWSRAWDLIELAGGSSICDIVGFARGANNILGSLSRRLEGNPTSFVPLVPDKWNLVIGRHLGSDAPKFART